jgi:hypothetical protein
MEGLQAALEDVHHTPQDHTPQDHTPVGGKKAAGPQEAVLLRAKVAGLTEQVIQPIGDPVNWCRVSPTTKKIKKNNL